MVRGFFGAVLSFEWLVGSLMADELPPGDAIFRSFSRVSTLLMFGEGAISSLESPAPSGSGVPERGVPKNVFLSNALDWGGIASGVWFRIPATRD